MKKDKTIKNVLIFIGYIILVFCIIEDIDGIGKFACILFGTIFLLIGTLKKIK